MKSQMDQSRDRAWRIDYVNHGRCDMIDEKETDEGSPILDNWRSIHSVNYRDK